MNIKALNKKLKKQYGDSVSASLEENCIVLRGSLDSWEDVVAALKADKEAKEFVKTKEECDKRALLKKPAEWLARFLLRVTQSETFGIEPKTDKIG